MAMLPFFRLVSSKNWRFFPRNPNPQQALSNVFEIRCSFWGRLRRPQKEHLISNTLLIAKSPKERVRNNLSFWAASFLMLTSLVKQLRSLAPEASSGQVMRLFHRLVSIKKYTRRKRQLISPTFLSWQSQNQMDSMTLPTKKSTNFSSEILRFFIAAPEKSCQRREGTCAFGAINKIWTQGRKDARTQRTKYNSASLRLCVFASLRLGTCAK